MTQPDDRELEQYLDGGSKLSRRYRDASSETSPPDVDEAILARARAELRRKPSLNRMLAPWALAASLVLGVNLAWNVYQSAPAPGEGPVLAEKESRDDAFVPEPPPPAAAPAPRPAEQLVRKARAAAPAPALQESLERDAEGAAREDDSRQRLAKSEPLAYAEEQATASQRNETLAAQRSAGAAAPAAALAPSSLADAAPLSESARIDHLINFIGNLAGATFVRNGKDYGATEAAKHLQHKREKAGNRVKTADDFIRLCASQSYLSGEAYLIRFADGRTSTAEDVLREELARISAAD